MAGLLIHLTIALLSLLIVHFIHFKWEFSWAIFIGNFIPDVIKFGVSAIKQGTFSILDIKKDYLYQSLSSTTSTYQNWFTLGFFILGLSLLLYHFHYIKKKKMEEYDELYVFLLIGIIIHLILDVLILENGAWI